MPRFKINTFERLGSLGQTASQDAVREILRVSCIKWKTPQVKDWYSVAETFGWNLRHPRVLQAAQVAIDALKYQIGEMRAIVSLYPITPTEEDARVTYYCDAMDSPISLSPGRVYYYPDGDEDNALDLISGIVRLSAGATPRSWLQTGQAASMGRWVSDLKNGVIPFGPEFLTTVQNLGNELPRESILPSPVIEGSQSPPSGSPTVEPPPAAPKPPGSPIPPVIVDLPDKPTPKVDKPIPGVDTPPASPRDVDLKKQKGRAGLELPWVWLIAGGVMLAVIVPFVARRGR